MRSLGMESILVGDVVDGVPDVGVRVDVAEATADDEALVLLTLIHQLSGFLMGMTVGELVAELVPVDADVVQRRFLHDDRLTIVLSGCREGDGDNSGEGDDLK